MGKRPRFNLTGVPQHIIQRGNNGEPCFYSSEDYLIKGVRTLYVDPIYFKLLIKSVR